MRSDMEREHQVAFWQMREAEERRVAERASGKAKAAHLELALSYANLIAQAARHAPDASGSMDGATA